MSNQDIRPTSIVGIKRLAKTIKVKRDIPHNQALNEAARLAGFESFKHAGNKLPTHRVKLKAPPLHRLFITAFWKDRDSGARGRETTWVDLSASWTDLVTRTQMQAHRSLVRLVQEAEDHFSYQYMFSSQSSARRATCASVRTFQFIDATKLRPSKAHSRVYPGGSSMNVIPGRDHSSSWYDPASKAYVFVDEPYERAELSVSAERTAWAEAHQYSVFKPDWPGMYNPGGPGGSRLFLITPNKNASLLNTLVAALNRLPHPMIEENWVGKSTEGLNRFISPAEEKKASTPAQVTTKAPQSQQPRAARLPQEPRPGRMPIEVHEEVGQKLKSVLADSFKRDGVFNRLNIVRGELDNWIQREYDPIALPMERFSEVYYGSEPKPTFSSSLPPSQVAKHVLELQNVKQIIERYYTKSQAKSVLTRIDSAIKSLQTWAIK